MFIDVSLKETLYSYAFYFSKKNNVKRSRRGGQGGDKEYCLGTSANSVV